jgi:hypothetical protein
MLEAGDPAVFDLDQNGSLGACLTWVSALKIAGIDDVRVLPKYGIGVNVA